MHLFRKAFIGLFVVSASAAICACGQSTTPTHPKAVNGATANVTARSATVGDGNFAYSHQEYSKALAILLPLAKAGNADAQVAIGVQYEQGAGVPQDYSEALRWYRAAARQKSRAARRHVGLMYEHGLGVAQDYAAAFNWFDRAAKQGDAPAQLVLGRMYSEGEGTEKNALLAHMWLSIAASSSDPMNKFAATARDAISNGLTKEQILKAQVMARVCQQSEYRECNPLPSIGDSGGTSTVPMQNVGGVYVVPVNMNNAVTINFVIDSGSSDVNIPADVVLTLMRTGTISESDFIGTKTYTLADGTTAPSATFQIESLKVGNLVLENVVASIGGINSPPLLGQSFLARFKSWSIDNGQHALVLSNSDGTQGSTTPAVAEPTAAVAASSTEAPTVTSLDQVGTAPVAERLVAVAAAAQAHLMQYFEVWSEANNAGITDLRQYYAETVKYYGAYVSSQKVMQDKISFASRWPVRKYVVRPSSLVTTCTNEHLCAVAGVLDWDATNPMTGKHSVGVAQFEYHLSDNLIVEEHGTVLSRSLQASSSQ